MVSDCAGAASLYRRFCHRQELYAESLFAVSPDWISKLGRASNMIFRQAGARRLRRQQSWVFFLGRRESAPLSHAASPTKLSAGSALLVAYDKLFLPSTYDKRACSHHGKSVRLRSLSQLRISGLTGCERRL